MSSLIKKLSARLAPLILLSILLIVGAANYTPGTWLVGWDNLLPELNMSLNIRRSLTAVWQEYQGLGLVGGMGHATDLIRQLVLLPFTAILPANVIRYLWHLGMLALGSFGVYFLLSVFSKDNYFKRLFSALFYFLNFGIIQIFWVPFEPFSTFFGFFPWLILVFWRLLTNPNRQNWLRFFLLNLLATPSYYVQTIFVVYVVCLTLLILPFLKKHFILFSKAMAGVFLVNAFWLLPFGYFILTNGHHPRLAKTNIMYTHETILRNQERGGLDDFLLLRGYYYDFPDGSEALMSPWQNHFSQSWTTFIGWILAGLIILGLLSVFLVNGKAPKSNTLKWGIIGIFLLSAFFLLSATPPFNWLNQIVRQSAFIDQAFRSPFTKLVMSTALAFSVLFYFGLNLAERFITGVVSKVASVRLAIISIGGLLTFGCLLAHSLPVFKGNYFYPAMRVTIPPDYFALINYLKSQPKNLRLANLPQGDFWGWTYYRWGSRGSGFIWYGIEQPIMDRAFDVWQLDNEQYYWELNYALQNNDPESLEQVFEKYFVGLVVFDDYVYFPGNQEYAKQSLKTKNLLEGSSRLHKIASFGQIDLYRFDQTASLYQSSPALPSANAFDFSQKDAAFDLLSHYQTSGTPPEYFFPFAGLITNRFPAENTFSVTQTSDAWTVTQTLPDYLDSGYLLNQPPISLSIPITPDLTSDLAAEILPLSPEEFVNPHACAPTTEESLSSFDVTDHTLRLSAKNTATCVDWGNYGYFKNLTSPVKLQLSFDYRSETDEWPQYCLWDNTHQTCLNTKDHPPLGFSRDWRSFTDTIIFNPEVNQIDSLVLILDANNIIEEKSIQYRNLTINLIPLDPETLINPTVFSYTPQITRQNNKLTFTIPQLNSNYFIRNPVGANLFRLTPENCYPGMSGNFTRRPEEENGQTYLRLSTADNSSCVSWYFGNLPAGQSWLVKLVYRNIAGYEPFSFAHDGRGLLKHYFTKLEKSEDWITSYLITPPYPQANYLGLNLSFSTYSFSSRPSVNDLAGVEVVPFPWSYLKSLYFAREEKLPTKATLHPLQSSDNLWHYRLTLPEYLSPDATLILPQSYDSGWIAFYMNGWRPVFLKNHTLVNNWANGWKIDSSLDPHHSILVMFWPQLLQYLGFALLVGTFAVLALASRTNKSN